MSRSRRNSVRRAVRDLAAIHPENRQPAIPPTSRHTPDKGKGAYSRKRGRKEISNLPDDTLVR